MSTDNWTVVEHVLTLSNNKGDEYSVVKLANGKLGVLRAGESKGQSCGSLAHCIDIIVKLAGINLDPR